MFLLKYTGMINHLTNYVVQLVDKNLNLSRIYLNLQDT